MQDSKTHFDSSPLTIAARKARWIFDGLDTGQEDKVTLLAQAMTAVVHGYDIASALPNYQGINFRKFTRDTAGAFSLKSVKETFKKCFSILGVGELCRLESVQNNHEGTVSVVCGDSVELKNVSFKGKNSRNLVVICNNAKLSDVSFNLNGMGLVIIGANANITNCSFDTNANNKNGCILHKTLLVYPNDVLINSNIDRILRRKVISSAPSKPQNDTLSTAPPLPPTISHAFSTAMSNQYSEHLRNIEDTKEYRRELTSKDELFHQIFLIHNTHFASKPDIVARKGQPRVACLMMQRNEESLLKPWVEYYSELFGSSNLYIFDNGSTNSKVTNYLASLSNNFGIHVDFSHQSSADFRRKGVIFQKLIKELEALDYYDFFIPLDCDEFISLKTSENEFCNFTLSRDEIYTELNMHKFSEAALKVTTFFNNKPHCKDKFYEQKGEKTFFTANTISSLDHGFHKGETISKETKVTALSYVHFHNKPLSELKEHAYNKLIPFFDIDDEKVLAELVSQRNRLALNLLDSKETYEKRFDGKATIVNDTLCSLVNIEELERV